jgi:GxxExxY protein
MEAYLLKDECYKIIGACMEVHSELGSGFLEAVYEEALRIEFDEREIPFASETKLDIFYKGEKLKKYYTADFICYDQIIIEIKALDGLTDEHLAQVLNYLKATGFRVGLLINFGTTKLQYKRVIL